MRYDVFIKKYSSSNSKNKFIKDHVVNTYIPYTTKIAEAKEIVKRTCYREINGKNVFQQDSTAFFMLFMLRILRSYTDIEYEDGADALEAFDAISKAELWEPIIMAIPAKEYDTFDTVLHMVKDDEMENYRSIAGFFESKVDALSMILNTIAEAYTKSEEKE